MLLTKILFVLIVVVMMGLLSGCCHTPPPCPCETKAAAPTVADSGFDSLTYVDSRCGFRLDLPHLNGWTAGRPAEGVAKAVVYAAVHFGRITNVVLSSEPLNGENEDYFFLIRRANRFENRQGYEKLAQDTLSLNGAKAIRFVYRADVIQEPSDEEQFADSIEGEAPLPPEDSLEADTLPPGEVTPYVYTNILTKAQDCNVWLEISTPSEAYERKKGFIQEIIQGLKIR